MRRRKTINWPLPTFIPCNSFGVLFCLTSTLWLFIHSYPVIDRSAVAISFIHFMLNADSARIFYSARFRPVIVMMLPIDSETLHQIESLRAVGKFSVLWREHNEEKHKRRCRRRRSQKSLESVSINHDVQANYSHQLNVLVLCGDLMRRFIDLFWLIHFVLEERDRIFWYTQLWLQFLRHNL